MTGQDRELLELAAKAAGFVEIDFLAQEHWANVYDATGCKSAWNPLTDDGDVFRLAIKCRISFGIGADTGRPRIAFFLGGQLQIIDVETDRSEYELPIDIAAATRLAIVRAAAEIGRKML